MCKYNLLDCRLNQTLGSERQLKGQNLLMFCVAFPPHPCLLTFPRFPICMKIDHVFSSFFCSLALRKSTGPWYLFEFVGARFQKIAWKGFLWRTRTSGMKSKVKSAFGCSGEIFEIWKFNFVAVFVKYYLNLPKEWMLWQEGGVRSHNLPGQLRNAECWSIWQRPYLWQAIVGVNFCNLKFGKSGKIFDILNVLQSPLMFVSLVTFVQWSFRCFISSTSWVYL